MDRQRATALWTLGVDAVTAEVTAAFGEAGVDCILLKGPALATWLYRDGPLRHYGDTDLLVHPAAVSLAACTLERIGFRRLWGPLAHSEMRAPPACPWRRGAFVVDLHEAVPGATADRLEVWTTLRAGSTEQWVAGTAVRVLGEPARLAQVALHAGHHGPRFEEPLRDLRRALELLAPQDWVHAAAEAERIGATAAFATGLQLVPQGRAIAARLGVEAPRSARWLLEAAGEVPVAAGLERLSTTTGVVARASILRDELLPSPEFMRWWTPLARRSRRGLAAAYAWRLAYLLRHLPGALRAWRRARIGTAGPA